MTRNTLEYLTANDWVLILSRARRRKFSPGEQIIEDGVPSPAVYIIRKGTAAVQVANLDGRAEVALLGPGEICGDMSFLLKSNASATVVAKDAVEAEEVDTEELDRLFESFPGIGSRFYHSLAIVLSRRLQETSSVVAELKNQTKP